MLSYIIAMQLKVFKILFVNFPSVIPIIPIMDVQSVWIGWCCCDAAVRTFIVCFIRTSVPKLKNNLRSKSCLLLKLNPVYYYVLLDRNALVKLMHTCTDALSYSAPTCRLNVSLFWPGLKSWSPVGIFNIFRRLKGQAIIDIVHLDFMKSSILSFTENSLLFFFSHVRVLIFIKKCLVAELRG